MIITELNENLVETSAHELFDKLEYETQMGSDHYPGTQNPERQNYSDVILEKRLLQNLKKINPGLPQDVYDAAIGAVYSISKNYIMVSNRNFYELLLEGYDIKVPDSSGKRVPYHIDYVDWKNPKKNNFLAVRQFRIKQKDESRIPDHVIFLNGIPIVIFEYKNPYIQSTSIEKAYHQLGETDYQRHIPKLFHYNVFTVISDLYQVQYGTFQSPPEFFFNWYDKHDPGWEDDKTRTRLHEFIKDVFPKEKLLNVISRFIEYEDDGKKIIKKIARKHQMEGVNKLVNRAIEIYGTDEKRIGTVFHGTGSGKSMTMIFFAEAISKSEELENPTLLVITDRNDLDDQLSDFFKVAGFPNPKPSGKHGILREAKGIQDLRKQLEIPAGNIIFTTIQKFQLTQKEKQEAKKLKQKARYPILSTRNNIILICDEAHRSQYRKIAQNLRRAFPNALRVGFTATPLEEGDRDTPKEFGPVISTYTQAQSVKDGTTVKIEYQGRLANLHVLNQFIGKDFDGLTAHLSEEATAALAKKWTELVTLVEREDRMNLVAEDLVFHFNEKKHAFPNGKAMLCASTKMGAAKYYEYINKLPNHPKCICAISSGTGKTKKKKTKKELEKYRKKEEYLKQHYRSKKELKDLIDDFKDEDNDNELLIICDMYLTGFDAPLVHTLYVDKPLRDHNLFQAASRVNRKSKPEKIAGYVIDYIGIGDDLKKSFKSFNENDYKDTFHPTEETLDYMENKQKELLNFFKTPIENRFELDAFGLIQLIQSLSNEILESEETKLKFFKNVVELTKAYSVCTPDERCIDVEDDMVFFQKIRAYLSKNCVNMPYIPPETDIAVGRLLEKGLKISDAFEKHSLDYTTEELELSSENLKKIGKLKHRNLKVELAYKLLDGAIKAKFRRNKVAQKTFSERLEKTLSNYHKRHTDFEKVYEELQKVAKDATNKKKRHEELGLSDQEIVFYDAIAAGKEYVKSDEVIVNIAKELYKSMKASTTVDWLNQESIRAQIRSKIKQILIEYDFPAESFEKLVPMIFQQVEANYSDMDFQ